MSCSQAPTRGTEYSAWLILPKPRSLRSLGASLAPTPKKVCPSFQLESFPTCDSPTCLFSLLDSHIPGGPVSLLGALFSSPGLLWWICPPSHISSPARWGNMTTPLWVHRQFGIICPSCCSVLSRILSDPNCFFLWLTCFTLDKHLN